RAAITHGTDVSRDRNVGILRFVGTSTYVGTGTLIGRKTVLTAAFVGPDGVPLEFCDFPCGNVYNCTPACVSGILTHHPQFDGQSFDFAVGVITLSQDFTGLTGIYPLRLGGPPSGGDVIEIAGYGSFDPNSTAGFGQKRGGINNVAGVN